MFEQFAGSNAMDWNAQFHNRLSQRAARIMPPGRDIVAGKSVLDLGARDGRWSWAAHQRGARSTIGVEGRQSSIDEGAAAMRPLVESNAHRTLCGDVYEVMGSLARLGWNFDVVFCLGFIYHVYDHWGLMQAMAAFKPGIIVIDGEMDSGAETSIRVRAEWTNEPNNAVSALPVVPVGNITTGTMELLAKCAGYALEWQDWANPDNPLGCDDYRDGTRHTCILTRTA